MTHELLPCPTCGSTFRIAYERPGRTDKPAEGGSFYLAHETSPYRFLPSEAEAVADWNRRISSTKSEPVAVKALEWEQNGRAPNSIWSNNQHIDRYYTIEPFDDTFEVETKLSLSEWGPDNLGRHRTMEAAKAAAQADYESRIRSALSKGGAQ